MEKNFPKNQKKPAETKIGYREDVKFKFENRKLVIYFDFELFSEFLKNISEALNTGRTYGGWFKKYPDDPRSVYIGFPKPLSAKTLYSEHAYSFISAAKYLRNISKEFDDMYHQCDFQIRMMSGLRKDLQKELEDRSLDFEDRVWGQKMVKAYTDCLADVSAALMHAQAVDKSLIRLADNITAQCKNVLVKKFMVSDKMGARKAKLIPAT